VSNFNILRPMRDPKVFGPFFSGKTWDAWFVFLAALFALPMDEQQLATYIKHTGRTTPPTNPHHEAWLVIGRRGGKSFVLATIAVFLACAAAEHHLHGIYRPERRQCRQHDVVHRAF
jgi:hypothetical protein